MPNHFTVIGICSMDHDALEASGKEEHDFSCLNGLNLCSEVNPLPKELETIVSTTPLCRYIHKETGEVYQDCNGPMGAELSNWNRVPLTLKEVEELESRFGYANWYDWQSNVWGTKWGTYDLKTYELGGDGRPQLIEFQCAWCAPNAKTMGQITEYIRKKCFVKDIHWIGFNPSNDTVVPVSEK